MGAAGLALVGAPGLAACRSDDDTASSGGTEPGGGTASGGDELAEAWRLSTRNQRAPCSACRSHAAHRFYATREAADADRAHPGCNCDLLAQSLAADAYAAYFVTKGLAVHDDRWTD